MYLWRNLPEGQLLAVLRWMQARREEVPTPTARPAETRGAASAAAPAPTER